MNQHLTVVTFNLRMDNRSDGENYFFNRSPFVLSTIVKQKPDVLCFQEATPPILEWLRANLYEYTVIGTGRGPDLSDEANPVAFRKDKFELFALDQFWLSPTPHIPGSRYEEQSPCPRICMTAILRMKQSNDLFRVYNTHLDHVSEYARKQGMDSILVRMNQDARAIDLPAVLCGDMNAIPAEACIKAALKSGLGDLTSSVKHSFHDFGRCSSDFKIDYIFGNAQIRCIDTKVWDMKKGPLYLSDHYPIECLIELKTKSFKQKGE